MISPSLLIDQKKIYDRNSTEFSTLNITMACKKILLFKLSF